MNFKNSNNFNIYYTFLNSLARDLTKLYYTKLNKTFTINNKLKGEGYDPVTSADKAFEKYIRQKINERFPDHQIIGEEFGIKKTKSDFSWIIDPIDGTRSFVAGNPTWSNLISLNYKNSPIIGLANFPRMQKYYLNENNKKAYVFENGKKRRLSVNKKVSYNYLKVAAAFHGYLSLDKQKKINKFVKKMNFPCFDALTYCQLTEGRLDIVAQCANKIWDIHPIMPIVRASGAIVTTWENKNPVVGGNIIVSNNMSNHKKILKLLKPLAE